MKKLAAMQPYFFPYLGYFQLAHAVDEFVFLDDVTYIKRGYINRNSILLNGQPHRFSVPVRDVSQFRAICDHYYAEAPRKFLDLLRHAYHHAPWFRPVFDLAAGVFARFDESVAVVNAESVAVCFRYLGLDKSFDFSSRLDPGRTAAGDARLIQLCKNRGASVYLNAPGGRALYDPRRFVANGLKLGFIEPSLPEYPQKAPAFVPGLSILDVLMWNSPEQVLDMLGQGSVDYPAPQSEWSREDADRDPPG